MGERINRITQPTYERLKEMDQVVPNDIYCRGNDGRIYQRVVTFKNVTELGTFSWREVNGGHCLAPTDEFMQDISDHDDDPRLAMSDPKVRKKYGGHPDERLR